MLDHVALIWRRFAPLEEQLLAAARTALPAAAQATFDAQVAAINLVQRSPPSWQEICFYRTRWWRADWSEVALFPCTDEVRVAEVRFHSKGRKFKATLTCIGGHICDFATTPGPKDVAFAPWEGTPTAVLLNDPLRAPTGAKEAEPVPQAWADLLRRRAGQPAGEWQLYDEASAYRLVLGEAEYLILAERCGEEFILCRIEPAGDGLFHLIEHDGAPEPMVGDAEAVIGSRPTTG